MFRTPKKILLAMFLNLQRSDRKIEAKQLQRQMRCYCSDYSRYENLKGIGDI